MSIDQPTAVKGLMKDRARLIAYIYAIVRDWHLAEDLFQDVSALAIEATGVGMGCHCNEQERQG